MFASYTILFPSYMITHIGYHLRFSVAKLQNCVQLTEVARSSSAPRRADCFLRNHRADDVSPGCEKKSSISSIYCIRAGERRGSSAGSWEKIYVWTGDKDGAPRKQKACEREGTQKTGWRNLEKCYAGRSTWAIKAFQIESLLPFISTAWKY